MTIEFKQAKKEITDVAWIVQQYETEIEKLSDKIELYSKIHELFVYVMDLDIYQEE